MTTTAMEHPEDGANPAYPPVVLTINSQSSQRYLTDDNQLLVDLYGIAPERINLSLSGNGLYNLLHPNDEQSFKELPALFPYLSWSKLKELIETPEYYEVVRTKFTEMMVERAKSLTEKPTVFTAQQMLDAVQIVIIDKSVHGNPVFTLICRGWLPNASFYIAASDHGLPQRIELYVKCRDCRSGMREAGTAYVCEVCGGTRTR